MAAQTIVIVKGRQADRQADGRCLRASGHIYSSNRTETETEAETVIETECEADVQKSESNAEIRP